MTLLRAFDRLLVKVESALLVVVLSTMILLAFFQVVLRNVWGVGFLWADPLVRHLVIWVGFLGAAIATHEGRHISIDALTKFLPPRVKAASNILTSLFAIVVCAGLAYAAFVFLKDERISGDELFLSIPLWISIVIIPAGYALMMVHFAVNIIQQAVIVAGREGTGAQ